MEELEKQIIDWAVERGIMEHSDPKSQLLKTMAEVGELADAVNEGDLDQIKDGIGDVQVTLAIIADMYNLDLFDCLQHAYDQIKSRQGEMVNGVFVKEVA